MRLLYITNARMPTEKAHGWQIVKMCEAFAKAGAYVELFVPKRRNHIKEDAFSYYGIEKRFNIQYLPCLDLVRFGKLGFYVQVFTFTVSAVLVSLFKKSDAIYSRDEVFSWAESFFRKNVFYEMHDYPRSHGWLYKGLFKRVAKIVSTNQIKKNQLMKEFGVPEEKIIVASNGIDLANFTPASKESLRNKFPFQTATIPQHKKIVSYIGNKTFGQPKGEARLVEAFSQLSKKRDDIFFLLTVINHREFKEVESIFQKHSVPHSSYWIQAHAPRPVAHMLMQLSDVLVMNYPNTEHYAQFMSPIKMFEYMASGTPIVSSDLPSIREVLNENNAVLVEPGNTEALAAGINKVLNDEAFAKRIAAQAQEDVKKYGWNKRAKALISMMHAI
ncbi:hypothetical protein BK004_01270 [bacterium CG10_46_32]|nr:MAG: hypothetical protein BK004_01270 [bacterium CG10_46_32]